MTQDDAGSAPMRGSHVELHRAVRALLDGVNARYPDKNPRQWTCPHMQALDDMTQSEPQPTLTAEEREAIEELGILASEHRPNSDRVKRYSYTVERLLRRTK